jgi:hypothetical protein
MKLLLDENLLHDLRHQLTGHSVFTVAYMGWSGMKNGELLQAAAVDGFDALVTMDSGVAYQQNLTTLPLAVVVLGAASNDLADLLPLVPTLLARLNGPLPRAVVRVQ